MKIANKILSLVEHKEYESQYKALLGKIDKLPWESKPRKSKNGAVNIIAGKANGKSIEVGYHKPDKNGDTWAFLYMSVDGKVFDKSEKALSKKYMSGTKEAPSKEIKDNLKEIEDAIKEVMK
jgi:hypothetical protein